MLLCFHIRDESLLLSVSVSNIRFSAILDFPYLKLGIRDLGFGKSKLDSG